jgi:hypothetical protein
VSGSDFVRSDLLSHTATGSKFIVVDSNKFILLVLVSDIDSAFSYWHGTHLLLLLFQTCYIGLRGRVANDVTSARSMLSSVLDSENSWKFHSSEFTRPDLLQFTVGGGDLC